MRVKGGAIEVELKLTPLEFFIMVSALEAQGPMYSQAQELKEKAREAYYQGRSDYISRMKDEHLT